MQKVTTTMNNNIKKMISLVKGYLLLKSWKPKQKKYRRIELITWIVKTIVIVGYDTLNIISTLNTISTKDM